MKILLILIKIVYRFNIKECSIGGFWLINISGVLVIDRWWIVVYCILDIGLIFK